MRKLVYQLVLAAAIGAALAPAVHAAVAKDGGPLPLCPPCTPKYPTHCCPGYLDNLRLMLGLR